MWLQYDISRETFADLVKREFKKNPPKPVDVTSKVTGGLVSGVAQMQVTLKDVKFTHVPPVARTISTGEQIKADTMGLILLLQPVLKPVVGKSAPLSECKAIYRFSAEAEAGRIKFRMDYHSSEIPNDPGTLLYEKDLKNGFKKASRAGILGPSLTGIFEVLKVPQEKHPILDVGVALEALKPNDVDILVDVAPASDRAGIHWDAFFTKAGQTRWGDRGGKPVGFTIWSNFLVWYVEQKVKELAIKAGKKDGSFTYGKMTRRAKFTKMDPTTLIKEGYNPQSLQGLIGCGPCWEKHGIHGTFKGTGHGSGQDAEVSVDWFARFMLDPDTSMLYTHVDTTVYTNISTSDYAFGFLHEVGSFFLGSRDDEGPVEPKQPSACGGRKLRENEAESPAGPLVISDPSVGKFSARNLQTLRFMDEEWSDKGDTDLGWVFAIFAASDGFLTVGGDLQLP